MNSFIRTGADNSRPSRCTEQTPARYTLLCGAAQPSRQQQFWHLHNTSEALSLCPASTSTARTTRWIHSSTEHTHYSLVDVKSSALIRSLVVTTAEQWLLCLPCRDKHLLQVPASRPHHPPPSVDIAAPCATVTSVPPPPKYDHHDIPPPSGQHRQYLSQCHSQGP